MGGRHGTVGSVDAREIDDCVTGCAAAHQRLLGEIDGRLAAGTLDTRAPSRLPDWTVGHVLAHLIGNAEALSRLFEAAGRGEVGVMYPGGAEGRRTEIETRSAGSAEQLVAGVRRTVWALEAAWSTCTAQGWQGRARPFVGDFPMAEVPLRRWREVEVHHTDLGWGHEADDWDPQYVRRDLAVQEAAWLAAHPEAGGRVPAGAVDLSPGQRLAWLLGRSRPPGLPPVTWP